MTQSRETEVIAPRPALWMRRPDKKKHILQVMESMTESGAGGMTALHIADRAGYRVNPSFRDLLWELVDEGEIYADSKAYNGGACDVRWLFYLPEVWRTKKAIKKMRQRHSAMKLVIQVFVTVHVSPRQGPDREPEEQRPAAPAVNPLQPVCPACGWSKMYDNLESARKALAAHKQHCAGEWSRVSPFAMPIRTRK